MTADSIEKLDSPSNYNMLICQALLHIQNMVQGNAKTIKQESDKCEGFLAKARIKFPNNRDPSYLKTINMII